MLDNIINIAVERGRDIASAITDTVVGNAILWEVVGTNFFATVAATDKITALRGELGVFFVDLDLEQA